ncbi:putative cytidine and deoxycytidylate deaminase zinc-binding region [Lyophyllum shimeji]|uniref:Cytidine and deoxycytidylate deaminase zinc-binding region n=1 Tax=Lyophyllum shimeji TaxID=47721 RepID=A0A9P3Q0H4_LYOSH|nr:putative cytidine and deoxycytidylate deaminase zinc-binding region [Lyophyllum shimeji]
MEGRRVARYTNRSQPGERRQNQLLKLSSLPHHSRLPKSQTAARQCRTNLCVYLTRGINVASMSPVLFSLGSVIAEGGKVYSSCFNHQRPRYDEAFARTADKRASMHAEMHAVFNVSGGKAPPLKWQLRASFVQCTEQPPQESRSWPRECLTKIAVHESTR